MRFLIITILFLLNLNSYGQRFNDLKLANQYAKEKDCQKAIELYKGLSKNGINLKTYYKNYFSCLIQEEKFSQALSLSKKMLNREPKSVRFICDQGIVYKAKGEESIAKRKFEQSINKLSATKVNDVHTLANQFNRIGEYEYAIRTFEKGQILFPNYEFGFSLANGYRKVGNTEKMIDTYIELVIKNPKNSRNIQINLQNTLGRTKTADSYDLLKRKLLSKIQKTNDIGLTEMLIWFLIETDDYKMAHIYTKAIDKQLKENGKRVFNLAQLAHENSKYDEAIKAYQYLIDQNKEDYLIDAKILKLIAQSEQLTENPYSNSDLINLNAKYLNLFQELGKNLQTVYVLKEFAYLNIFHLFDLETAKQSLIECIKILTKGEMRAECKLMLADIYLLEGKEWDAILTYSQVDNDYKQNPIGHEAKFRRAKISYYQGDFDWAQAQLDVLKASTSKLIANNAMKLSLLITDNMGLDTSATAMQMYARSELLEYQNKFEDCILILDSINSIFKDHPLIDEVLFKKAKIMERLNKMDEASALYQKIIDEFSFNILADDALFFKAKLLEKDTEKIEDAKLLYEKLLLDHPDSIYTNEARNKYRTLNEN